MPQETETPRAPDSRVRDHLANERTFLAWVRTGVSLVGFGIVIAKIRYALVGVGIGAGATAAALPPETGRRSTLLGGAFAVIGLLTLLLGAVRYLTGERAIERNTYQPGGGQLLAFAALLLLLGIAVLLYLSDLWRP
jgi:putative membrane protein